MDINFPKLEEKILKFWQENKIFEKSLKRDKKLKNFVFYEGPPTANGRPGIHHVEARTFKDVICRFKTMQGFLVERKAGWDTHGLPVELEVEKTLGLKSKKEIEEYGIGKFNQKCKESVWKYKADWERMTERIAFWLDLKNPYITYQTSYIETVWWILKKIFQKGLLYQGYKVVPYCPRCGTSLSSHEVALGYKKVAENSIYFKLKVQNPEMRNTYLLVWTTTPWTLPGNAAVAVNPKAKYVKAKIGEEYLILAESKLNLLPPGYEAAKKLDFEKDLKKIIYEPVFDYGQEKFSRRVVAADFVSLKDGTGIVHIAPAFGEDDMEVGRKNDLPVLTPVNSEGKFKLDVKFFAGMFVKTADPLIVENLKNRNLLFKEKMYEHDYPFCWRCGSVLLYYAKQSWFINMQKVKSRLILNNKKINWVPSHLKEGRFGEWLKDIKDWAISRERYWGTPLPLWQCQKCKKQEFIGSLSDLLFQKFSDNNYYILRHGHSLRQLKKTASCWPEIIPLPLTEKGKKQVSASVRQLKKEKIDFIFSSDLLRTKETSQIVARETGGKIIFDKRLREWNVGIFNGRDPKLVWDFLADSDNFLTMKPEKGESLKNIAERMYGIIKSVNEKYKNKNILFVSHELPLTILQGILKAKNLEDILKERQLGENGKGLATGSWRKISFADIPLNKDTEIDLHKPYIDNVKFYCKKCAGLMKRIPEVIDCWFDSGSMPFAQYHYPFENKGLIDKKIQFPADYISEAIDQTRGWFYTLLAISTLLDLGPAYKNVISLGHVLDEKGEKMSKSKGNVVDPWYILDKYGADSTRWYFYTINQPGDPKFFSEKDVGQALKKFLLTFWNSFLFFDTYRPNLKPAKIKKIKPANVLDKWVISRFNGLVATVTEDLEKYDVVSAARALECFLIDDFSQWYVRRSRKRFHSGAKDARTAAAVFNFCLSETAKLSAPFIPFLSEEIFQRIGGGISVHLAAWPKADKKLIDKNLENKMQKTREIVSLALAERAKSGIKVRQPLASLKIKDAGLKIKEKKSLKELVDLLKEEVNVKEVVFNPRMKNAMELDKEITKELKEEGFIREVVRNVQVIRKEAGFMPKDKIFLCLAGEEELSNIFLENKRTIIKEARIENLVIDKEKKGKFDAEKEIVIDGKKVFFGMKLV